MIFSGDSDLRRVTEAVQRRGVRVNVISSLRSSPSPSPSPSLIGDDFRRQVDQFVELTDFAGHFTRRAAEPNARQKPFPEPALERA